jgi:hypothetical protein
MKRKLLTLVLGIATYVAFGQAFDGLGDHKLSVTTSMHVDGSIGVEFNSYRAISDYVSSGFSMGYIVLDQTDYVYYTEYDLDGDGIIQEDEISERKPEGLTIFLERFFYQYQLNGHFGEVLGLDEKMDIYAGLNVGKNFGGQVGGRYMFGEAAGLSLEINLPIVGGIMNKLSDENDPDFRNNSRVYERPFFQLGILINL